MKNIQDLDSRFSNQFIEPLNYEVCFDGQNFIKQSFFVTSKGTIQLIHPISDDAEEIL